MQKKQKRKTIFHIWRYDNPNRYDFTEIIQ